MQQHYDVIIIGGGQSGLATAYYLRRNKLSYLILDEQATSGGAWLHAWESLHLFSPAEQSSLPGWMMPKGENEYPNRQEVIEYLKQYEARYKFPIQRDTTVQKVTKKGNIFEITSAKGTITCTALVSATGTWSKPFIPEYPNQEHFRGQQLHSAFYQYPEAFEGQDVLIVGGGNSAAQILAELSKTSKTTWVTLTPPKFLADDIDGRYLFNYATKLYQAKKAGLPPPPKANLGDIVMVESVKEARTRKVLHSKVPFEGFTETGVVWEDGTSLAIDTVIWCTGFHSALDHLTSLQITNSQGRIATDGTRATELAGLWLVGYGSWTGFASATLIGVGRSARQTAKEISDYLST